MNTNFSYLVGKNMSNTIMCKENLMKNKLKTAITFIIYNRPDKTKIIFESIKQIQPDKLFLIADGPNQNRSNDQEKCAAVRKIIEEINWPCEVYKNYAETNMGCKKRVVTGLNWVFEYVEDTIILEDDCLPDPSFYLYCQELLDYYRNNERVMIISGNNFQNGKRRGSGSYFFSRIAHIWGWATWKRAWKYYDVDMKSFPSFCEQNTIANVFRQKKMQTHWMSLFKNSIATQIDTWDYQLLFMLWANNGISITPQVNLVRNIGFGPDALHTKNENSVLSKLQTHSLKIPLVHSNKPEVNEKADLYTFNRVFSVNLFRRILNKLRNYLLNQH